MKPAEKAYRDLVLAASVVQQNQNQLRLWAVARHNHMGWLRSDERASQALSDLYDAVDKLGELGEV